LTAVALKMANKDKGHTSLLMRDNTKREIFKARKEFESRVIEGNL